jgi:hypothetical protein
VPGSTKPDASPSTDAEVDAASPAEVTDAEPERPAPTEASSSEKKAEQPEPATESSAPDGEAEALKSARTTKASRKKGRGRTAAVVSSAPAADKASMTSEADLDQATDPGEQPAETTVVASETESESSESATPAADVPGSEAAKSDLSGADTPKADTPKAEAPEAETVKAETAAKAQTAAKAGTPTKADTATKDEAPPKADTATRAEAPKKADTATKDEAPPKIDTATEAEAEAPTRADSAAKAEVLTKADTAAKAEAEAPTKAGTAKKVETPKKAEADASKTAVMASTPDAGRTRIIKQPARTARTAERPTKPPAVGASPVSGAPGFGKPSRPAWQPMTVRDPSSGPRGITVFGTTLTRRQTVVAIGVLIAVLLALVVLVPQAFADDEGDQAQGDGRKGGGAPVASATGKPSSAPAAAVPAPTTTKPSPPPTSKTAAGGVPKGWYLYNGDGYSVPVPNGSSVQKRGSEVYFTKNNRLLIIDHSERPKSDPVADWQDQEADRRGSKYRNYDRVALKGLDFHGKAADWEFTYTTDSGNPQHAVKRGFITTPGKQAYSISWYTSPDDWDASQKDLQIIYQGFKPKR